MALAFVCPRRCICAATTMLLAAAAIALAQSNTIRFIIGTAPGGAIDPYARIVADPMAKALNQTIIVEIQARRER